MKKSTIQDFSYRCAIVLSAGWIGIASAGTPLSNRERYVTELIQALATAKDSEFLSLPELTSYLPSEQQKMAFNKAVKVLQDCRAHQSSISSRVLKKFGIVSEAGALQQRQKNVELVDKGVSTHAQRQAHKGKETADKTIGSDIVEYLAVDSLMIGLGIEGLSMKDLLNDASYAELPEPIRKQAIHIYKAIEATQALRSHGLRLVLLKTEGSKLEKAKTHLLVMPTVDTSGQCLLVTEQEVALGLREIASLYQTEIANAKVKEEADRKSAIESWETRSYSSPSQYYGENESEPSYDPSYRMTRSQKLIIGVSAAVIGGYVAGRIFDRYSSRH